MPHPNRHAPWEVLRSTELYSAKPWIQLSRQEIRLPNGKIIDDYHQILMPEYTVIYALTTEGKVIVEKQYKHGPAQVSLVLPAGTMEPGEVPLASAQRELLEETGYASDDWTCLNSFVPNANYGCGRAHLFLARNARPVAPPNSGDLEEIEILLMDPPRLIQALRDGEVLVMSMAAAIAIATHPLLPK